MSPALSVFAVGAAGPGLAVCGVRSESRATTMVIAAARTARPASCPPIRRGSSGSEDEAWVIAASLCVCLGSRVAGGELCGVTTGNRPDSPAGLIVAPGMGASVVGGRVGAGLDVGVWATTVVIVASAGDSDDPATATVRVIGSPAVAVVRTRSVIMSSNA